MPSIPELGSRLRTKSHVYDRASEREKKAAGEKGGRGLG